MWTVIDSPIGELRLVGTDAGLQAIDFSPFGGQARTLDLGDRVLDVGDHPVLEAAATQLAEYFAGDRRAFDLPLDPVGTDFQRRVWSALCEIGYGETASYGEIAGRLGLERGASRAVGAANGRNPIPVVVPCHRVVGANGSLTGFAGGLERKQVLLDLERPTAALF